MKPIYKFGLVGLGYLAAFVIASAVTAVRIALTSGPDASAYSGMLAFWELVGFTAVVVAATGVMSAVLFDFGRAAELSFLGAWAQLSPLRSSPATSGSSGWSPSSSTGSRRTIQGGARAAAASPPGLP